jgi:hypothetical protein
VIGGIGNAREKLNAYEADVTMKPTDTQLGCLTRLAQLGFAVVFLFLFGTWMDRMREQNDWTWIWSAIGLWTAFFCAGAHDRVRSSEVSSVVMSPLLSIPRG